MSPGRFLFVRAAEPQHRGSGQRNVHQPADLLEGNRIADARAIGLYGHREAGTRHYFRERDRTTPTEIEHLSGGTGISELEHDTRSVVCMQELQFTRWIEP